MLKKKYLKITSLKVVILSMDKLIRIIVTVLWDQKLIIFLLHDFSDSSADIFVPAPDAERGEFTSLKFLQQILYLCDFNAC